MCQVKMDLYWHLLTPATFQNVDLSLAKLSLAQTCNVSVVASILSWWQNATNCMVPFASWLSFVVQDGPPPVSSCWFSGLRWIAVIWLLLISRVDLEKCEPKDVSYRWVVGCFWMFERKPLRFAPVESIRQVIAQQALQSEIRSVTFSLAPSIYQVFQKKDIVFFSNGDRICQHLGGRGREDKEPNTEPCTCEKKWSEACGPYLETKKILDMNKRPDQAGDPSRCYCTGSEAESRVLRKEVKVSALRFCQSLFVEAADEHAADAAHAWWSTGGAHPRRSHVRFFIGNLAHAKLASASARCQKALVHPWSSSSWKDWEGQLDSAGRLDRIGHRWEWHLDQVCQGECEELVDMMNKSSEKIIDSMSKGKALHLECADRVVQQVEANLLGCCGRSCGWDGHSCALWPFLEENQQQLWQVECCGEYTVLKGSDRERMCDSVLTAQEKKLADADDPDGTDEDAESVGQNEGRGVFPRIRKKKKTDGQSLLQTFQQDGRDKVGCDDADFVERCPADIKKVHSSKCEELGQWEGTSPRKWGNYLQFEDCDGKVGSQGTPKSCREEGGRSFRWKWAEEAADRTSKCCTFHQQPPPLPKGKAANTYKNIHYLMTKVVMFRP